jgi:flagellar protein FlgJ
MNIEALTSLSNSPAAALSSVGSAQPGAAGSARTAATTDAQRKKAAAQFEAILVRQLLSQSVGSMMGGTGHTSGMIYGDMMTDVLAQKLTAGQGLGLGRMIEKQLAPAAPHAAAKAATQRISP